MYVACSCGGKGGKEEAMTTIVERRHGHMVKTKKNRFKCRQLHMRMDNHVNNDIVRLNPCCGLSMLSTPMQ